MTYGIVYMYKNLINGKVYIGQTIQPIYRRRRDHRQDSLKNKTNMPFHKAIIKYGFKNFKEVILCTAIDKEDLDKKEIEYINIYKSFNKEFGYNVMLGGSYGKHSNETKEKISKASIKLWQNTEHKSKMSKYGKENIKFATTPESKKKSGLTRRGRHATESQLIGLLAGKEACKKPVIRIDPITNVEIIYSSSKEAATDNNTTPQKIWNALNRTKSHKHRGFIWRYAHGR